MSAQRTKRPGRGDLTTNWAYDQLWAKQGGRCAICGIEPVARRLAVDHDHRSGRIRGLLCTRCNLGLGYFQDRPERLAAAAVYLAPQPPPTHPLEGCRGRRVGPLLAHTMLEIVEEARDRGEPWAQAIAMDRLQLPDRDYFLDPAPCEPAAAFTAGHSD